MTLTELSDTRIEFRSTLSMNHSSYLAWRYLIYQWRKTVIHVTRCLNREFSKVKITLNFLFLN